MDEIQVTPGVTLGALGVVMLDERVFEIASADPEHPLTEHKAKGVAEALKRQDMFDEVNVELREEEIEAAARLAHALCGVITQFGARNSGLSASGGS